ncbi:MAG: hypothetical protein ACE15B_19800 [Bryobacteraceae bacterium]
MNTTLALLVFAAWFTRDGNVVKLGSNMEVEWLTSRAFRLRRAVNGGLPAAARQQRDRVRVAVSEGPASATMRTAHMTLEIGRKTARMRVTAAGGEVLAEDRTGASRENGGIAWERLVRPGARLFGLGPRADDRLDARGKRVAASVPFLLSTAGYAEYHVAPGEYTFDLTRGNRIEIRGGGLIDFFFAHGATPKEIYEELHDAGVAVAAPRKWAASENATAHASLSGILRPRIEAATLREFLDGKEMVPFLDAYEREADDKGLPLIRPLPMQFSVDHADMANQFMVGDELLVAPMPAGAERRDVYLPMGMWTRLDTGERHGGRRTVEVRSRTLPVFARAGSIVPFEREVRELHYFPKLAGEFFFFEPEANDWTQVHAAPAADSMRLEIESKVTRIYEWVVHHAEKPRAAGFSKERFTEVKEAGALAPGTWFFDAAQGSLHVRVRAGAGEDRIVNLFYE